MRTALWTRLSRLVVRLYPPELRERYGREVEELLSRSTSAKDQARDLVDVAWCAALERAGGITFAGVRRWALRVMALTVLVPVATFIWVALAVISTVLIPSMVMPDMWWNAWITLVYTVIPAFVLIPLAFLISRLLAQKWTLPPVVVAGCMAAGAFGSAGVPGAGSVLSEVLAPAVAAIAVWLAGMLALVAVSAALRARVPGVVSVPAVMVMAYVVLSAATAAYAATLRTFEDSMWAWSPLWYPIALTGGESTDFVEIWPAYDNAKFLPQVLAMLTIFVLSWRQRSRSDALTHPTCAAGPTADRPAGHRSRSAMYNDVSVAGEVRSGPACPPHMGRQARSSQLRRSARSEATRSLPAAWDRNWSAPHRTSR